MTSRVTATTLSRIEPQPPAGIKYMLGGETWMPEAERSPVRMLCEEWGNLGVMELDPSIQPNDAGFRVRHTEIPAPPGCYGFTDIDGIYYWTAEDMYGRTPEERNNVR